MTETAMPIQELDLQLVVIELARPDDAEAVNDVLRMRFTSTETLKHEGTMAKIWEERRLKHGL